MISESRISLLSQFSNLKLEINLESSSIPEISSEEINFLLLEKAFHAVWDET
jgi:hypothetical protein